MTSYNRFTRFPLSHNSTPSIRLFRQATSDAHLSRAELVNRREAAVDEKVKEALEFKQEVRSSKLCMQTFLCLSVGVHVCVSVWEPFFCIICPPLYLSAFQSVWVSICECSTPSHIFFVSFSHSFYYKLTMPTFKFHNLVNFKLDENNKREAVELEAARTKHEKSLLVRTAKWCTVMLDLRTTFRECSTQSYDINTWLH